MLGILPFAIYRKGTEVNAVKSLAQHKAHTNSIIEFHIGKESCAAVRDCAVEKGRAVVRENTTVKDHADVQFVLQ